MTRSEAECFRALRRWRRQYLHGKLKQSFRPKIPFNKQRQSASFIGRSTIFLILVLLAPLLALYWLIGSLRGLVIYPAKILLTHVKPPGLRAPGERNIQGVHYQFARHIELPPELYLKCLDEWVAILYGKEKLPKFSINQYLDTKYLLQRRVNNAKDRYLNDLLINQISNAREELSRDLGYY